MAFNQFFLHTALGYKSRRAWWHVVHEKMRKQRLHFGNSGGANGVQCPCPQIEAFSRCTIGDYHRMHIKQEMELGHFGHVIVDGNAVGVHNVDGCDQRFG